MTSSRDSILATLGRWRNMGCLTQKIQQIGSTGCEELSESLHDRVCNITQAVLAVCQHRKTTFVDIFRNLQRDHLDSPCHSSCRGHEPEIQRMRTSKDIRYLHGFAVPNGLQSPERTVKWHDPRLQDELNTMDEYICPRLRTSSLTYGSTW